MSVDTATNTCPDVAELNALAAGALPAGDISRVLLHVTNCESCLEKIRGAGFTPSALPAVGLTSQSDTVKSERDVAPASSAGTSENYLPVTGNFADEATPESWRAGGRSLLSPPQGPDELGRLGGYRILRVLGEGGMGIVFEAQDVTLARHVAIKVLRPGEISPDQRKRFLQEAQLAASISSDRIVTVHRVGEDNGALFIVMELLSGETLESRLKSAESLPVTEALRITREVAEGLAAAHDKQLVHRDIKPANVWLETKRPDDAVRRVKLLDFGVARPMAVHEHLTQSGNIVGTPSYMSPEQACGSDIDQRSDLFSLGCLLYAMLSGKSPFERANYLHTLKAVVDETPHPLGQLLPGLPSRVTKLVERLLQKDANSRPSNARQVVSEIRQIEQHLPSTITAGPGPTTFRPAIARARQRLGWGVWIGAATIVAAVSLGALGQYHELTGHSAATNEVAASSTPVVSTAKGKPPLALPEGEHEAHAQESHSAKPTETPTASTAATATQPVATAPVKAASQDKTATTDSASPTTNATNESKTSSGAPAKDGGRTGAQAAATNDPKADPPVAPASWDLPSIKIGVIHSLTGPMAVNEAPIVDAVLMAVNEINEGGGLLNGRPVEAIVRDGKSNELGFSTQAEDLITNEKVVTIFGGWRSPSRKLMEEVCERHDHLLIYPTAYEGLEDSPNVIYMGGAPNQQALPAVKWAFAFLNKRKFFLIGVEGIYSRSIHEIIRDELATLGGAVVGEEYRPLGEVDFSEIAQKVKASNADVIINSVSGAGNISLIQCLRKAGIEASDVPTISLKASEIELQNSAANAEDLVGDYSAMSYFESLSDQENQDFLDRLRDRYGPQRVANDPMAAAYTGVYLWARGVNECRSARTSAIREAILTQMFEAPEGDVHIDPDNRHAWRRAMVGQVNEDLQYDIVWASPKLIAPEPFPASRTKEEWETFQQTWKKRWNGAWRPAATKK